MASIGVTNRPKRYRAEHRGRPSLGQWLYACLGCGVLDVSSRRDKATCSVKCRVRLHRTPGILEVAATMKVELALIAHSRAVRVLEDAGVAGAAAVASKVLSGELRGAEVLDAILPVFYAWLEAT